MDNDVKQKKTFIASLAVASPPCSVEQGESEQLIQRHYKERLNARSLSLIKTLFAHPSIKRRSFAVEKPEILIDEDPDERMKRFTLWTTELSTRAAVKALERAKLSVSDIGGIVVNTCTGYICPGISTYLIERLGFHSNIRVYDLVGSGCGGAIPNLEVAAALAVREGGRPVLSISVEICTATYQMENDLSLLLSNTLFGDGASAAVVCTKPEGYEFIASASHYVPEQRDSIRYVHKKGQLHNQLSLKLPGLVQKAASQVVADLLGPRALQPGQIRHWALHSGGEKIINAVRDGIGLSEGQVLPTRRVLENFGNMSSPTVWFVLEEIEKKGIEPGEWCMMLAFGAGLSAHACLLRKK